ncbi:unnamed protein product, partial [Leptidea sinapis]
CFQQALLVLGALCALLAIGHCEGLKEKISEVFRDVGRSDSGSKDSRSQSGRSTNSESGVLSETRGEGSAITGSSGAVI